MIWKSGQSIIQSLRASSPIAVRPAAGIYNREAEEQQSVQKREYGGARLIKTLKLKTILKLMHR